MPPAHLTIGADVFYDLHLVCFSDGVLPGKVEVGGADRAKTEDFRFAGSSVVRRFVHSMCFTPLIVNWQFNLPRPRAAKRNSQARSPRIAYSVFKVQEVKMTSHFLQRKNLTMCAQKFYFSINFFSFSRILAAFRLMLDGCTPYFLASSLRETC